LEVSLDIVVHRLYNRLYRLLTGVAGGLGGWGGAIVWALPEPSRALPGDAAFLAVEVLWGHLSGASVKTISDGYGLEARAYAAAICSLLGGQGECWRLARGSRLYDYYLERCRGIAKPLAGEKAEAVGRELAFIVEWIRSGRATRL